MIVSLLGILSGMMKAWLTSNRVSDIHGTVTDTASTTRRSFDWMEEDEEGVGQCTSYGTDTSGLYDSHEDSGIQHLSNQQGADEWG